MATLITNDLVKTFDTSVRMKIIRTYIGGASISMLGPNWNQLLVAMRTSYILQRAAVGKLDSGFYPLM